jgi:glycosylphosphatidylinositol deacylase
MRRRPSGSFDEDHDDSTDSLPTTPSGHGDKANEHQRGVEQTLPKSAHAKDRRKDVDAQATSHLYTSATAAPTPRTKQERTTMNPIAKDMTPDSIVEGHGRRRSRLQNPWSCSLYTLATTLLGFAILGLIVQSFMTRQLDTKGCEMSYMRPSFAHYSDFDTEHTRFASKYSLYLYREGGIDEDTRVGGMASGTQLS